MNRMVTDLDGKPSSSRAISLGSFAVAAFMGVAPIFGLPETDWGMIASFLGLSGGVKLWQRSIEAKERVETVAESRGNDVE